MSISYHRTVGFLSFLVVLGCSDCRDKTETLEYMLADGEATIQLVIGLVERFEDQGYDCSSEAIRNGSGQTIGRKYTCTKCV